MRYRGQSYELEVALTPSFIEEFHAAHQQAFGHSSPESPVEVVNLRLRSSLRLRRSLRASIRSAPNRSRPSRTSILWSMIKFAACRFMREMISAPVRSFRVHR